MIKPNINIELLKRAVKANHAVVSKGMGMFPGDSDHEEDPRAPNAALLRIMKDLQFSDGDVIMELGVEYSDYLQIAAYAKEAKEADRFKTKLILCKNYYNFHKKPSDRTVL